MILILKDNEGKKIKLLVNVTSIVKIAEHQHIKNALERAIDGKYEIAYKVVSPEPEINNLFLVFKDKNAFHRFRKAIVNNEDKIEFTEKELQGVFTIQQPLPENMPNANDFERLLKEFNKKIKSQSNDNIISYEDFIKHLKNIKN